MKQKKTFTAGFMVHGAVIAAIYVVLSNLLCGAAALDVVFGSLATLIGAVGSYVLRDH